MDNEDNQQVVESRMDVESAGDGHECDSGGSRRANLENESARPRVVTVAGAMQKTPPRMVMVRPSGASPASKAATTPSKFRIDKIAENLKINLQQKEQARLKETSANVVANVAAPPPPPPQPQPAPRMVAVAPVVKRVETVKPTPPTSLAKAIKEEDELERNDDLTNLGWLANFNLAASVGLPANYPLSLSPPISPPPQPAPSRAAAPQVAVVRKYAPPPASAFTLTYGGDEADGGGSLKPATAQLKDISALLKPYLADAAACASKTSPAASVHRPPYSFSCLTFLAIESSQRKRLSVKEIYNWITQNFPYYRSVPSGSWKNSIRHNLSYNHCFAKVDKNLLAMRDFSGKGSLWCINPEFRPLLIETLLKTPMTSEQNQLACIPFLQDVTEAPKTSATSSAVAEAAHQRSNSLTPGAVKPGFGKTARSLLKRSSSLVGSKAASPQLTTTIINPRIASRFLGAAAKTTTSPGAGGFYDSLGRAPKITQIAAGGPSPSRGRPVKSADACPEMDAVNALLAMKSSRVSGKHSAQTPPRQQQHQPAPAPEPTSRRKQVFKPATKRSIERTAAAAAYMDDDDSNELNEDEFIGNLADEPTFDEDDDEIEEGQVLPAHKLKRLSGSGGKRARAGKLLVKFPCFKGRQEQHEADEEDDDEEPGLTIDDQEEQEASSSSSAGMNALLGLSLAARLVEDHKQALAAAAAAAAFKSSDPKAKRPRKN